MKNKIMMLTLVFSLITTASALSKDVLESEKVAVGTPIVQFNLQGTDGKMYSNQDFATADVLVLIVTCNHCPYAKAAWQPLTGLQDAFADKGVQFVAVNPNDAESYPEDSFENMKEFVQQYKLNFPYLYDENQQTAKQLGAVCTPDVFVYGKDRTLYFRGRVTDNLFNPAEVTDESLKNALNDLLNGNPPPSEQNNSFGCSIKWKK